MSFIPYGKQAINQQDIQAVIDVLTSDYLTQGPQVPAFEQAVASYCGVAAAVAVNSATSALHIAYLALGLGKGDILWTTPNTFVATANAALFCGAEVDFVDIEATTYNLSVEKLAHKLEEAERTGKLPKIVVPVHFAGQSCDMKAIHALSLQYGFAIVEDASHAIGASYLGRKVGSCQYSDITIFSFHPVKIITTAEGGLATSNLPGLVEKMQLLRSHGITREPHLMTHSTDGPWYYQQVDLGFNYRMTEMQAALGLNQMTRLDAFVTKRHELAKHYDAALKELPIQRPFQSPDSYSSYHLYPIVLQQNAPSRAVVFEKLRLKELGVNVHYIPVHTQPYYQGLGFKVGDFPNAESYYQNTISIPLHQGILPEQQTFVIDALCEILQ